MLREGLKGSEVTRWIGAAAVLNDFARFSGRSSPSPLETAREAARSAGDVLGEANCIKSLGDIALERSDHEEARRRYDEALPLYRRVGVVRGEANCIKSLGDIALARSDDEEARCRYDEALPLYRRVGDVLGEANCIQRLGDIARNGSEPATAKNRYAAALALYARIPEPWSMGQTHRLLARLAANPAVKQHNIDTARALWTQIDRPDLVAELDREFGPPR
jgi:tetratricopeptide (TPR) repeat protein